MRIPLSEERGVAMITAVLISVAVLLLGIVAVGIAAHDSTQSARNRERIQSVAAAEAGIDYYLSDLVDAHMGDVICGQVDRTLTFSPGSRFRVDATFEDSGGNAILCSGGTLASEPSRVVIRSRGTAVGEDPARTMEAVVTLDVFELAPLLPYAIFADQGIDLDSNTQIIGSSGNDADIYTNGNVNLDSNTTVSGSVFSRGSVSMDSNSEVKVDVHVGNSTTSDSNNINMGSRAIIRGDAIAEDDITLSTNSRIFGSARAGGTVSGGHIGGSTVEGPPAPSPPPSQTFPTLTFDPADWQAAGYTVNSYSSCSAAKTFVSDLSSGGVAVQPYVVRITADCDLSWTNANINVRDDLAIVTDGGVSFGGNVRVEPVGGPHDLFFILGQDDTAAPCDFTMNSNARIQPGLNTFVHTPCSFVLLSNTSISDGQFFGGQVSFNSNSAFLNYSPVPLPGNNPPGWTVTETYRREVRN